MCVEGEHEAAVAASVQPVHYSRVASSTSDPHWARPAPMRIVTCAGRPHTDQLTEAQRGRVAESTGIDTRPQQHGTNKTASPVVGRRSSHYRRPRSADQPDVLTALALRCRPALLQLLRRHGPMRRGATRDRERLRGSARMVAHSDGGDRPTSPARRRPHRASPVSSNRGLPS